MILRLCWRLVAWLEDRRHTYVSPTWLAEHQHLAARSVWREGPSWKWPFTWPRTK